MHWDIMMSLKQTEGKPTQNMYLYEIAVISLGVKSKTLCAKGYLKQIIIIIINNQQKWLENNN